MNTLSAKMLFILLLLGAVLWQETACASKHKMNYTMTDLNNNTPRLYNPKAYAPALYIPAWLSQIPNSELKYQSKLVYGRLAQWSTNEGRAHRSAKQLSEELGMPERTVERCLQELRDKKLIGCFQPRDGGHNHFEFYDHPWMYRPINEHLCYKSNNNTPPAQLAVPPAYLAVPTANCAVHKIKEIKEIKKDIYISEQENDFEKQKITPSQYQETYYPSEKQKSDETFEQFWNIYPKKKSKNRAQAAWLSQKCYLQSEKIIGKLNLQLSNDKQYIDGFAPHPDKYILEERWTDEISTKKPKSKSSKNLDHDSNDWANLNNRLF